ncbi:MAG: HlyC/CorC family transporter [Bacteroidaceae bacterium]|nr:HlyC/CorC family transporter [Bacteroidaceae bacterium]MBR3983291.1 HlyC/CorC family transporter [Bacteroidaceae bacterium]
MPDTYNTLFIEIFIVLMFSAFFSGTEIAFVSSNKMRFEMEREDGGITSRIIDIFYKHPSNFISTILVGNNIALVIYGILMAKLIEGLILQTIVSTLIVLFTGEFLPKMLFRINPNRMLRVCAFPAMLFYILLWPISKFTSGLSHMLLFLLGMRVPKEKENEGFRKADLDHLIQSNIDNIDNEDMLEDEVKIFQNALDFRNVKVRDCIVPRTEIVAVGMDATLAEIRSQFTDSGMSKLIIYKEDLDDIVGFLHSSEMFHLAPNDDWTRSIRETPIVPETMSAQKLLSTLMSQKKSIAVVVDEFGGTSGIVTVEDLVEEIFGDIEDEHDNNNYIAKQLPTGEYHISARMEIEKANDLLDIDLPESDDYLTVGGWILNEYQSFPKLNEVIQCGNWNVKVTKKTANKIEEILLSHK